MIGVEKKEEFMGEQRLRSFGQVKRMDDERTPVKEQNFIVDGSKKGRPKKKMERSCRKDMMLEV